MGDKKECNYCMQEMKTEQDPRQLPCGHIFCLRCLKADFASKKQVDGHQCITCRLVHEEMDVDSLPNAQSTDESAEAVEEATTSSNVLFCDRCLDKPAVRYCIDCGEKSCARHIEHHDGYYEDLHKTLDILKYAENPSLYNKAITCEQHKERITMACRICYQYNCSRCCEEPESCDDGQAHIYYQLPAIDRQIRKIFDDLLKKAAEKSAQILELEKQAWNKQDELLVKCKEMVGEVERLSAEQIKQIKVEEERLKASIKEYEAEKVNQVVTFVTELIKKKEEVDRVRKTTHKFLRNRHVTDLIKVRQDKVDLLSRTNAVDLGCCEWTNEYLHKGNQNFAKFELKLEEPHQNPFGAQPAGGLFGAAVPVSSRVYAKLEEPHQSPFGAQPAGGLFGAAVPVSSRVYASPKNRKY